MRHIVICGLSGYTIFFSYYFIEGTIVEKMLLNIKCVFRFSLQFSAEAILILKKTERDVINNIRV